MSKEKSKEFRDSYKANPVRVAAVNKFEEENKGSLSKETRQYMWQILATIGLEIEERFPDVVFDDDQFQLFGREKSKKSIASKKKISIKDFDKSFEQALEHREDNVPTEIRPIFDFYAFKLVCTHIKDLDSVLDTIDKDIKEAFPNGLPGVKDRLDSIYQHKEEADRIQQFLSDNSSIDVSNLTYRDYYEKIIECNSILHDLSYEPCFEERQDLEEKIERARQKLSKAEEEGSSDQPLDKDFQKKASKKLRKLFKEISAKRTNKLDLAVGDLMIFDILNTSEQLERLGVTCSKDPSRTKEKRTPNGYVSNFYSFDLPNGLKSELQIQSGYRYEYGENGPAAHNKMPNNDKERKFIKQPKSKKKYQNWEKKQFKALPKYFTYKGGGNIHVYNTFDNFRRYYSCEKPKKVTQYVQYIASHNINLLCTDFKRFSLTSPSVLDSKDEER